MKKRLNDSGMPKGTGAISKRGNVYWILYLDADGKRIQENSQTDDIQEARQILARRALISAYAHVRALLTIAYPHRESPTNGDNGTNKSERHAAGVRPIRRHNARVRAHQAQKARGQA